ncbi:MAG: hydroxyacid dehydrogenase, partial [Lachnospiraceae bacterium]|nr:hydroxyacid dehydrogenase [Candidatus Minthocola equi]
MKVLIPEEIDHAGWDYLQERGYEIVEGSGYDSETIKKEIVDVDAVLARGADYTRDVIAAGNKLQIIARHGVGIEHIDFQAAEELGVQVANVLCANSNAVAEHTIMMMLMLAKYVPIFDDCIPEGKWDLRNRFLTDELQGKTCGIIGVGAVGIRTAKKAHYGLDMKVLGYDPYIDYTKLPDYVEGVRSLDELFERSDVVTIHCPLNDETRYMVTPELMAKL